MYVVPFGFIIICIFPKKVFSVVLCFCVCFCCMFRFLFLCILLPVFFISCKHVYELNNFCIYYWCSITFLCYFLYAIYLQAASLIIIIAKVSVKELTISKCILSEKIMIQTTSLGFCFNYAMSCWCYIKFRTFFFLTIFWVPAQNVKPALVYQAKRDLWWHYICTSDMWLIQANINWMGWHFHAEVSV